jgi:hypothetical protein
MFPELGSLWVGARTLRIIFSLPSVIEDSGTRNIAAHCRIVHGGSILTRWFRDDGISGVMVKVV